MKFRTLLLLAFLSVFSIASQAQTCSAYGYFTNSLGTVTFVDSSYSQNGHISTWSFGDGSSASGSTVTHTYSANGTYSACLTIFDSIANCVDTTCLNVTITAYSSSCNASFTYAIDSLNPLKVNFTNTSTGASSIGWWNGTAFGMSGSNPSHTYTSSGYKSVCVIAYDSSGNFCDSSCQVVYVPGSGGTTCNAAFTYSVDTSNGFKINFTNTSVGASTAYWWFGGSNSSTSWNPSFTYAYTGSQTICLTTYDSSGNLCDSVCQQIYVPGNSSSSCDATFSASINQNTASFYDSSSYNMTSIWTFGDGTTYTGKNPTHSYASSGTYTVCHSLYDSTASGLVLCDSECMLITVTLPSSSTCDASFYFYTSQNTVYFYDSAFSSAGLLWTFGDGNTSTNNNPSHTYASGGTYNVCLYVYDSTAFGVVVCDSSCQTVTVTSPSSCTASFTYAADTTNPLKIDFSNTSTGASTAYWWFGGSNNSNAWDTSFTFSSAGQYPVCLTTYDSAGNFCDSVCSYITVSSGTSGCNASYYLAIDTTTLYNLYIVNNSTGTDSTTSYLWTFGDGDSSTAQNPTHQYASFGLYELCLTITTSTSFGGTCTSTHCDSIGMDSNGMLLKNGAFGITIVNESEVLSVDDLESFKSVSVYPNPTSGNVTLAVNALVSDDIDIRVMNSLGQEVVNSHKRVYTGENKIKVDLSDQQAGLYFVNLRLGNQTKSIRVLVKR
ncbi:MAG: PKD domain-containing protein [Bacteroidia bacterium]